MQKSNGTINITTTGVVISPYYNHQNVYIEKLTSTYDKVRHKRNPFTGFFIDNDKTDLCFITHRHDRLFLKTQFPGYEVNDVKIVNKKQMVEHFRLKDSITPREVQSYIINQIIQNENSHQWFVNLSQGLGKTLLSVYLMSYFNVKTLIMCYNKDILYQWRNSMIKNTTINPDRIIIFESSTQLYQIVDHESKYDIEFDVFLCTPKLLVSFAKNRGYNAINVLFEKLGIGIKIFDEAHRNITNLIKINAFSSVDKTLYLSGDYAQSDYNKEQMYYKIFHNVPILTPTEEMMNTLKYTVGIVVRYNSHPNELEKASLYTNRGFSFYEYMKYQFSKDTFFDTLDFVLSTIKNINTKGYKVLILVNMIEHVDQLTDLLVEKYPLAYDIGRFHSNVSDEDKEYCLNKANLIVSTYQSFSTGIDVTSIKYVISCSVCTKIDDNQASGRARQLADGSDVFYFMFADVGFPYAKKKLNSRLRYLQRTKIKDIQVIDYDN